MLAAQLAQYYHSLFVGTKIWVRPPRLQRLSNDLVVTETPKNATTIADAKASVENGSTLVDYFVACHGPVGSEAYQLARECFAQSLAGLSVLSYLFGIKNRHDGNLMLDSSGHIFASDFSCVFGRDLNGISTAMEVAPFKLTNEYIDLMGGASSSCYDNFCDLLDSGLRLARDKADVATQLIQVAAGISNDDSKVKDRVVRQFQQKVMLGDVSDEVVKKKSKSLIEKSQRNIMTAAYDAMSNRRLSHGVEV